MIKIKGVAWPFKFVNGGLLASSGDDHIKESVRQIIGINKGEYIMKPALYSNINQRIFDPVNITPLMQGDIKEALRIHETRIRNVTVTVNHSGLGLGTSNLMVSFMIKGRSEITQISNIKMNN